MTSDHRRPLVAALLVALLGSTHAASAADPKEAARQHYVAGLDAAARKDFRLAIGEFLASYDAFPHPATARNVAKAYHDLGDLPRAKLWYRRFQQLDPSRASEVAAELLAIEEALDPIDPSDATPPPADTDKPDMAEVLKRLDPGGRSRSP